MMEGCGPEYRTGCGMGLHVEGGERGGTLGRTWVY